MKQEVLSAKVALSFITKDGCQVVRFFSVAQSEFQ